jgi:hypothetical protein
MSSQEPPADATRRDDPERLPAERARAEELARRLDASVKKFVERMNRREVR